MKRYLLLLLSVLFAVVTQAQYQVINDIPSVTPTQIDSQFRHQLILVDSLRQFIRTDLKLKAGSDFYTDMNDKADSMYVFLYVSEGDTIKTPASVPKNFWFFNSEDSAKIKSNQFRKQGYQTLLYKTAGMSNAVLNRKLLSYPDEAIAFILFHEATHRHIWTNIEYKYVEALCDAIANEGCIRFAAKTKMLSMKKALQQKMVFENAYAFLNKKRTLIDKTPIDKKQRIFNECSSKIHSLIHHTNQFAKDRMGYEVNNAYFLRVESYAIHYFEMKKQLGDNLGVDKVIEGLSKVKKPEEPKTKTINYLLTPHHFNGTPNE